MSIVQRFFTCPPLLFQKITKSDDVINEVSPNLYENLRDSSKQFIKAILNKDVNFIRQVSAKSLGQRIVQDLQKYQSKDLVDEFKLQKYHFDSSEVFEICPYVVFGEDFKTRIQRDNLWEDTQWITSNRFIKVDPKLSIIEIIKSYQNKQIFGFNCIYEPLTVDVTQSERNTYLKKLMITFQTDSKNFDPFIVDCQGALFEDYRAKGF